LLISTRQPSRGFHRVLLKRTHYCERVSCVRRRGILACPYPAELLTVKRRFTAAEC